jgi:hypothetical protein
MNTEIQFLKKKVAHLELLVNGLIYIVKEAGLVKEPETIKEKGVE